MNNKNEYKLDTKNSMLSKDFVVNTLEFGGVSQYSNEEIFISLKDFYVKINLKEKSYEVDHYHA